MMFYLIRILVVVAIVCLFIVISKKEMEMEQIENIYRDYIFGCIIYASCFVSN